MSVALFLLLGCSTRDEVKPTEDSLLTKEAVESIKVIKTAYQEKNRDVLINRLDEAMASEVTAGLFFEKVEISITPWIVKIKDSRVIVNIDWQGVWNIGGKEKKSRGIADFVFEGSPLKLIRVDGDDPFQVLLSLHKKDEEEKRDEPSSSANNTYTDEPEPVPLDDISNVPVVSESVQNEKPISTSEVSAGKPDEHDSGIPKILEDKKPDKLTTEIHDSVKKPYVVQVGAWRNPHFAQETLEHLREYYHEAVIVEVNNFNKIRVSVMDKGQADFALKDIELKLGLKPILLTVPASPVANNVKVPDRSSAALNTTEYAVQVGAWRNPDFAQEILGQLREYYPEAVIVEVNNFNKIRVPGVADKNQGNIIIRNIKEKFHLQSLLIQNTQ
jgi:cell division septation protein DedD